SAVPGRLPAASAHGRTLDLLAGRQQEPTAAVPRDTAQRSVAAPPRRGAEPAPPARPRPAPQRRVLDSGPVLSNVATAGLTAQPTAAHSPPRRAGPNSLSPPSRGADRRIDGLEALPVPE